MFFKLASFYCSIFICSFSQSDLLLGFMVVRMSFIMFSGLIYIFLIALIIRNLFINSNNDSKSILADIIQSPNRCKEYLCVRKAQVELDNNQSLLLNPIFFTSISSNTTNLTKQTIMGICKSSQKLNGIIDNQSSYEIIYHVSGSMKQLTDYQEQLNLGPKLGIKMQGVQFQGIGYNKKRTGRSQKYHSVARIPKHSFCSVGLNNIQVGCFLSIYAAKVNDKGKQVYKKLIFKDICIRTNDDICLRINKDLTLKQLTPGEITAMKEYFEKAGETIISTLQETTDVLRQESQKGKKQQYGSVYNQQQQQGDRMMHGIEYAQKKFGSNWHQYYVKDNRTGLFDLNHIGIKLQMTQFLRYDWAYLQSLQLDSCQIDDSAWIQFISQAAYNFPNLKNLYLGIIDLLYIDAADNKITTILDGDLEKFPALKILQLDYSQTQGINPLTEESKRYLLNFALEHPDILIYCASIDETKYLDLQQSQIQQGQKKNDLSQQQSGEDFEQYLKENPEIGKIGWYLFLPPVVNSTRKQPEQIRKSKISFNTNKKQKPKNKVKKQNIPPIPKK